jgi:hypothetical protein
MNEESYLTLAKQERDSIDSEIKAMAREIDRLEPKIKDYFLGKADYPGHREFVDKVQNYKIRGTYLNQSDIGYLTGILDTVQSKLYYNAKSWNQWEQDARSSRQNERRQERHYCAPDCEAQSKKPQLSIDTLWDMQRNKLKEKRLEIRESKEEFTSRMKKNYHDLKTKMTGDQKVAMVYDKATHRCILKIERRNYL